MFPFSFLILSKSGAKIGFFRCIAKRRKHQAFFYSWKTRDLYEKKLLENLEIQK